MKSKLTLFPNSTMQSLTHSMTTKDKLFIPHGVQLIINFMKTPFFIKKFEEAQEIAKRRNLITPFKNDYNSGKLGTIDLYGDAVMPLQKYELVHQSCSALQGYGRETPGDILTGFNLTLNDIYLNSVLAPPMTTKDAVKVFTMFKGIKDRDPTGKKRKAKDIAEKTAKKIWAIDNMEYDELISLIKEKIQKELSYRVTDKTIRKWISPFAPDEVSAAGRRKKKNNLPPI